MEFYTFSVILERPASHHSIFQTRNKCVELQCFSMILEPPAPTTASHHPNQEMHGMLYTFNDSGAAGAPPQHQEMHGILHISSESGAVGAPPQHYRKQEMHGTLYIFIILEPPAPHQSITRARKCIEVYAFPMILEPLAPHHSIIQATRKYMDFFSFSMIQNRKCSESDTFSMILRPPNTWNCPKQEMHGVLVIFNDFGAAGTPPQHYAKQEMHGILYIFKDSGAAGALPQHYPNQEMHGETYIFNHLQ